MDRAQRLVEVIERYDAWSLPWQFMAQVSSDPSLDADDVRELQRVWAEACESRLWVSGTLEEGRERSEAFMAARFPWLTAFSREQISRAASYQWR